MDLEESTIYEDIFIQGVPALLATKDGQHRISWADAETSTYILVYSSAVDSDTLLQVAESVSVSW